MGIRENMIAVKYIGSKPLKYDTVCHTPITWTPGSTRPVSPENAAKLLAYPTIWTEGDPAEIALPQVITSQQPVAPMAPLPAAEAEVVQQESQEEPSEPEPEEEFNAQKLLSKPFLALKNKIDSLSDSQLDEVNFLEHATKKRPGFLRVIQDELERRAQAAA